MSRPLPGRRPTLILLASIALLGCLRTYPDMAAERTGYAGKAEGAIVFAAIDEPPNGSFVDGARLATALINAEGLLGRPLELQVEPGGSDFDSVRTTVHRICANPRVSAVLGHRSSAVAIPASVIYEACQVLFLPPFATAKRLTLHNFNYVLRMLPDSPAMAAQTADVAAVLGHQRMAVLHSRDDYSRELAFLFEDAARKRSLNIVFRGSFSQDKPDYRGLLGQLHGVDFDAIYLSTNSEPGGRMLRQMRELGLRQAVFGSDGLKGIQVSQADPLPAGPVVVPALYDPNEDTVANQHFVADFQRTYGRPPDQDAAQGYDSVRLLAALVRRAGVTVPQVLSATAHYTYPWVGVGGIFAFDPDGNLAGRSYRFQVLRDSQWSVLPGVQLPYLLARYENRPSEGPVANDLQQLRRKDLGRSERLRIWLNLAHELLGFRRLGLVLGDSAEVQSALGLIRTVAQTSGFELRLCAPPPDKPPAQALVQCYSTLAMEVDALYVTPQADLDNQQLLRLNRVLRRYGVATLAVGDDNAGGLNLTLTLNSARVDLEDPRVAHQFDGIVHGMKIGDLNARLVNLPSLHLNADALRDPERKFPPEALALISRVTTADATLPTAAQEPTNHAQ